MGFNVDLERLGKEPIHPDQPSGKDIRYDPAFEALQAEVNKLNSPSASETVDWGKIAQQASEILAQKSKDLLVASYLAVALIYTRQMDGLALGLGIYHDLLNQFWDDLYPGKTRIKARLSVFEWWMERTETALRQLPPASLGPDQIGRVKGVIEKIDQFLNGHLEEPPSLRPLYDFFDSLLKEQAPVEPPQEGKETRLPPSEKKVAEVEKTETQGEISTPKEAQRVLNYGLQKVGDVAGYLWREDPSNPQAYRWARIAAWSIVDVLPQAVNGQTRIPGPPAQTRTLLNDLKNKGEPMGLLKASEEKISQFIFWIDLNRYVSEALNRSGDRYQRAREAVNQETAAWIYRLPGLEDRSFSDGTPFADSETRQWLKEIGLNAGGAGTGPPIFPEPAVLGQEEDRIEQEVREAGVLMKEGKLQEAIERIQQKLRMSFSRKERLLWRLALSQLLMNTKQTKLALPHLEAIIKEVDFYRLEEYDPELALRGLRLVWLGMSAQPDPIFKEKATETLHRIARLDLTEVIRLGKG
jgi:type VI secretion system protein VasJ